MGSVFCYKYAAMGSGGAQRAPVPPNLGQHFGKSEAIPFVYYLIQGSDIVLP